MVSFQNEDLGGVKYFPVSQPEYIEYPLHAASSGKSASNLQVFMNVPLNSIIIQDLVLFMKIIEKKSIGLSAQHKPDFAGLLKANKEKD